MDKQIVVFVKYFFGEETKIERKLFGQLWITTCLGDQVEFVSPEKGFRNYMGGPEIYRSSLLMMHHITGGPVAVNGGSDDIIACMAHGRELGIIVIPQGKTASAFKSSFAAAGFCAIWSWFISLVLWNVLDAMVIGTMVWVGIGLLVHPYFKRVTDRDAARIGQQYRDIFPEVHGSERRASRDAGRERRIIQ